MDEAELAAHAEHVIACSHRAYAPYSHFKVGCGLVDEQGQLHLGCNVENASYGLTLCAEAGAVSSMIAKGGKRINAIILVSHADQVFTPCGACRQRLWEHATADTKLFLFIANEGVLPKQTLRLAALLPQPFGLDTKKS